MPIFEFIISIADIIIGQCSGDCLAVERKTDWCRDVECVMYVKGEERACTKTSNAYQNWKADREACNLPVPKEEE